MSNYLVFTNAIVFLMLFLIWNSNSYLNQAIKGSLFICALLNSVWVLKIMGIV